MVSVKKEYDIRKEIKRLAGIRGNGTELISLYIPAGGSISEATAKLRDEYGQAANIKSSQTKGNVQGAIDKILQYLKLYRQPPKNGLAIFAGNVSGEAGKPNIELFSMEPQDPIKVNIYRCDSQFLLEPIEAMTEAKDKYVLIVMDGRDATVGLLKGTHITIDKKLHSLAHAKVRKGGQSANRYERLIAESIEDYFKRCADTINELYAKHDFNVKGLIIGGPGPTKENFSKSGYFNYRVKILGIFDTGYTDENAGMKELMDKAKDVLEKESLVQEAKIMERFMSEFAHGGLAVSGYDSVKKMLLKNNVAKLLISDGLELTSVTYRCSSCGTEFSKVEEGNSREQKHGDGGSLEVIKQSDAIEELIELADSSGVDVVFVSEESQYGKQLLLGLKGIAALLRYKM
jgi:peptide chain release factor subunit 1